MVRIRLTRMGKRHRPFYRIIVIDGRKRRDGAYIDSLGYYNPLKEPADVNIDFDKAVDWIMKGAQPSETVSRLFRKAGVLARVHQLKYGKDKEETPE
ncbi:MAG: 30S ribosomal protein S16 [Thermotogaceae bacterium]|nr:30S ribosomal protein S16 [Thermotogaceae bacterium]